MQVCGISNGIVTTVFGLTWQWEESCTVNHRKCSDCWYNTAWSAWIMLSLKHTQRD